MFDLLFLAIEAVLDTAAKYVSSMSTTMESTVVTGESDEETERKGADEETEKKGKREVQSKRGREELRDGKQRGGRKGNRKKEIKEGR